MKNVIKDDSVQAVSVANSLIFYQQTDKLYTKLQPINILMDKGVWCNIVNTVVVLLLEVLPRAYSPHYNRASTSTGIVHQADRTILLISQLRRVRADFAIFTIFTDSFIVFILIVILS